MATTYSPDDAINYAKRWIGNLPVDDTALKLRLLNDASNMVHMWALWDWSVGQFDQLAVVNDQQDYTISDPGDVLYPVRGEIRSADDQEIIELTPVASIAVDTNIKGALPNRFSIPNATTLRLAPCPASFSGTNEILSWYKKKNTVITSGNTATPATLLFDDEWFWVFQDVVLAKAMAWSHDPRAGQFQIGEKGVAANGQWGAAISGLTFMAQREKLLVQPIGEPLG